MKRILTIVCIGVFVISTSIMSFANEFKPGISKIDINQNEIVINNIKYDKNYKNGKLYNLATKYSYEGSILSIREIVQIAKDIDSLIK